MSEKRSFFHSRFQMALVELGLMYGGYVDRNYLDVLEHAVAGIASDADAQQFYFDYVELLHEYDLLGLQPEDYASRDIRTCLYGSVPRERISMWERVIGPPLAPGDESAALFEVERLLSDLNG